MDKIKGVILDYGGTLDSNGVHWAEVLWKQYELCNLPVSKENFREAYVYAERSMATQLLVKSDDDFLRVLIIKVRLQLQYLISHEKLDGEIYPIESYVGKIAQMGYNVAVLCVKSAEKIVKIAKDKYDLALVSNFYGNIHSILADFGLLCYFKAVIESAVVGVRKPNPAIFALGVEALGLQPKDVLVVGDSFEKDIVPAAALGCHTIWLKGVGWNDDKIVDETLPDAIITSFDQLINAIEKIHK